MSDPYSFDSFFIFLFDELLLLLLLLLFGSITNVVSAITSYLIGVSSIEDDGLFAGASSCRRCCLSDGEFRLFLVKLVVVVFFLKDDLLSVAVGIIHDLNRLSAAGRILNDLHLRRGTEGGKRENCECESKKNGKNINTLIIKKETNTRKQSLKKHKQTKSQTNKNTETDRQRDT